MKTFLLMAIAFIAGYVIAIQDCSTDACNQRPVAARRMG